MKTASLILMMVMSTSLAAQNAYQKGDIIPDFSLKDANGDALSLSNTDSKVIIINFWASWCGPCAKSFKTTVTPLYNSYDRSDLEIIGISNDKVEDKWRNALTKWNMTWKNGWDHDQSIIKSWNIKAIPTYMIVDRSGKVLASDIYARQLKGEVKKALAKMN